MTKQALTIWDLDNCLSNDEWRIKYIDWRTDDPWARYRMYHTLCGSDKPGNIELFKHWLGLNAIPVFCTARPEVTRSITQLWINSHFGMLMRDHSINAISVYMRSNNDHRRSPEVKYDLVQQILRDNEVNEQAIAHAFDDHEDVINMYRLRFGFQATVTAIHSTSAYERNAK